KSRFLAIPSGEQIVFSEGDAWTFPLGSVFLKHFEMPLDERKPGQLTRLETRVLFRNDTGVYGMTYRWNETQTDADLVTEATNIQLSRIDEQGNEYEQPYSLPGPNDCLSCHTEAAGYVLGVRTNQLNLAESEARS